MTLPAVVEQFDDGARRAVSIAREEAHQLRHKHVGTEHLLLGLLGLRGGAAYRALAASGVTVEGARRKAIEVVGALAAEPVSEHAEDPPFSARATRALERAARFAAQRGLPEVGSGQVLLAVLDVEGTAGQVLRGLGVDVGRLGAAVDVDRTPGARGGDTSAAAAGEGRQRVAPTENPPSPPAADGRPAVRPEGAPGGRGPAGGTAGRGPSPAPPPNAPLRGPRCSACASPLDAALAIRPMTPRKGGMRREVLVAYCSVCGSTLGVMPA
ncbi:MAG TPA: Clp protease N-terminal domain-containing protein [Acidimicrobiales bacterium]|nr:Clp protease N-terminal domain-containing protein [Acidimicrobiales bacterium]